MLLHKRLQSSIQHYFHTHNKRKTLIISGSIAVVVCGFVLNEVFGTFTLISRSQEVRAVSGEAAYWTLDGSDINWATGDVRDASVNGITGDIGPGLSTSTSPVSGKQGQALSFDGSDDYVSVPDNASLDFAAGDSFSLAMWAKMNDVPAGTANTNTDYFNAYDTVTEFWETNATNMVDNNTAQYASSATNNDVELLNGNTNDGSNLGTISAVEVRAFTYHTNGDSSSQTTYYFNAYDMGNVWATTPENMADGITSNYARTNTNGDTQRLTGNECGASCNTGTISAVEVRAFGYTDDDDGITITPYFSGTSAGDTHAVRPLPTGIGNADWTTYIDITADTNAPSTWTWSDVQNLDMDILYNKTGPGSLVFVSRVEIRVSYATVATPLLRLRPVFSGSSDGDNHDVSPPLDTGAWSTYQDITADTNAPGTWSWSDVQNLDMDVEMLTNGSADTVFVSKVEFRVSYTTTGEGVLHTLVAKGDASVAGYRIYHDTNDKVCFGVDDDATWNPDGEACTEKADFSDDSWHHIVAVKRGTTNMQLYIDGVATTTNASIGGIGTLANGGALTMGTRYTLTDGFFEGELDDIRIFNRALTNQEIDNLYWYGRTTVKKDQNDPPPTQGLVGKWTFENPTSTAPGYQIYDYSNNTNSARLSHGALISNAHAGAFGQGFSFNDAPEYGEYVRVGSSTDFDFTSSFTVHGWVNATMFPKDNAFVLSKASTTPGIIGSLATGTLQSLYAKASITYFGKDGSDFLGSSAAVGDLNGDGINDLAISAYGGDNTVSGDGETYVFYGPLPSSGTIDLDTGGGAYDVLYYGTATDDGSGSSVAIGDLNNDGYADLVIGAIDAEYASGPNNGEGEVYIIYGPLNESGETALSGSGVVDVTYFGQNTTDAAGTSLAIGDLNNDGVDDLVIGAEQATNTLTGDGETYVIYGPIIATTTSEILDLDGSGVVDVTYFGRDANDRSGSGVAVGDLNNDGVDDLVIGARTAESGPSTGQGETYIMFGPLPASGTVDLGGSAVGVAYIGRDTDDGSGRGVAAGDVNNDGIDDLVIGASQIVVSGAGETYVIYGPLYESADIDLDTAGVVDVVFSGRDAGDTSGKGIAVGDLNNDGVDDLIIGAEQGETSIANEGEVYVTYGPVLSAFATDEINMDNTDGQGYDVLYYGKATNDWVGSRTAIGDLNGDGYDDLVIGAPGAEASDAGETYIIYGPLTESGETALSTAGVIDVTYVGITAGDNSGGAVGVGDLNNDGNDDLIIGAFNAENPSGPGGGEGETYVIYGPLPSSGSYNLGDVGVVDVLYYGKDASDLSGRIVAAGDLNNDGADDLVIGAHNADNTAGPNNNEGETYILFGPLPDSGTVDLDTAGVVDMLYYGKDATDFSGASVAVGDVNNDGVDDLMIGAYQAENPESSVPDDQGEIYILFGPLAATGSDIDLDTAGVVDVLYYGRDVNDFAGRVVGNGDLNNDGIEDIIIGAYQAGNPSGPDSTEGETYIIYGPVSATSTAQSLYNVVDRLYYGKDAADFYGSAASVGDLNHDGFNDLVTGAYQAENTASSNEGETYVKYGPFDMTENYSLRIHDDGSASFSLGSVGGARSIPNQVNGWTALTGVYNASANLASLYINGRLAATSTISSAPSYVAQPLMLGSSHRRKGGRIHGAIDEFLVYNRALSYNEVVQISHRPIVAPSSSAKERYAIQDLNEGLIGFWSFNGKDMNWSVASSTLDRSGNTLDGKHSSTMATSTAMTAGKIGQAMNFIDSSSETVSIQHGGTLSINPPLTMAAWIRIKNDETQNSGAAVFSAGGLNTNYAGYWMLVNNTGDLVQIGFGDNTAADDTSRRYLQGTTALKSGEWYHVVGVIRSATDMDIYVNGATDGGTETGTGGATPSFPSNVANIGAFGTAFTAYMNGAIDELRVYNRALSLQEITNLYNTR